jgi:hypothetical protein
MVAPGVQVGQVLSVDKLFIMQVAAAHQLTAPVYMDGVLGELEAEAAVLVIQVTQTACLVTHIQTVQ